MNEIDRIINCCGYDDELFRTYITCLKKKKKCSETFQQIQLQWNFLKNNPHLIEKVCEDFFAFEALHLTDIEWKTIINCMGNK